MSLTTDRNDPDLGHGTNEERVSQNKKYLILSEEERAKGFIRPVRQSYVHVGLKPTYSLRSLTDQENERYGKYGYVAYEEYPQESRVSSAVGRFWEQKELDNKGCGTLTTMNISIAETYARDPSFYGSTFCCGCSKHLPVAEFVWDGTNEKVGS